MVKVGIVGAGLMGSTHAVGWAQTPATLAGFYALNRAQAEAQAALYGCQVYDSLEALLKDVEIVDVCSPTDYHHEHVMAAANAGKHIVCEKPIALSVAHAREMVAACQARGTHLLIAHVVRFFPEYALAKATVMRGEIGDPAVVRLTRCSAVPRWTTTEGARNWFLDPTKSGGMMVDLMIHDFDYARWISGDVVSVYARSARSHDPGAAGDYGIAILTHQSGAISNVEGGWCYPQGMFRTALEIAGSDGVIEQPVGSATALNVYMLQPDDTASVPVPRSPLVESPYVTEIKHFYDVIVNGAAPRVTAEDGLRAVEIALAAVESAKTGRPVKLESAS